MNNVVPFKTPQGKHYLRGLFYEETLADKSTVSYTLKDDDYAGYPSLRRLYLETNDPTEYEFACKYLAGWKHWEMLSESAWFKPYVTRWRKELDLRLKSKALVKIMEIADKEGKEAFNANKFILSWKSDTNKVGRPSKNEIIDRTEELKAIAADAKRLQNVLSVTA
jgi:hypothetical protein